MSYNAFLVTSIVMCVVGFGIARFCQSTRFRLSSFIVVSSTAIAILGGVMFAGVMLDGEQPPRPGNFLICVADDGSMVEYPEGKLPLQKGGEFYQVPRRLMLHEKVFLGDGRILACIASIETNDPKQFVRKQQEMDEAPVQKVRTEFQSFCQQSKGALAGILGESKSLMPDDKRQEHFQALTGQWFANHFGDGYGIQHSTAALYIFKP